MLGEIGSAEGVEGGGRVFDEDFDEFIGLAVAIVVIGFMGRNCVEQVSVRLTVKEDRFHGEGRKLPLYPLSVSVSVGLFCLLWIIC